MKISETIEVGSSPEKVWALFQDVPELAACLPGAELLEGEGGGVYAGRVSVKLGPMSANFEGEATVTSDPETMSGEVQGKGVDKSGGSMGRINVQYRLEPTAGGTRIDVDADVQLSGPVAQFGRTGLIKEMSSRLIGEFVSCLEAKLAAETTEEAAAVTAGEVRGFSLFFTSLWSWLKSLLRRLVGRG